MRLPNEIRERFRRYGRVGGRERAARMSAEARSAVARRAAVARWVRQRFGAASFAALGLPGGDLVDAGLADLALRKPTAEAFAVSLAATRLRREGVPLGWTHDSPEGRLYQLLARTAGDLAHERYNAYRRQVASFADACRNARLDRERRAS